VAQAFALPDARSIIMLRATRTVAGRTSSNIVWEYPETTIPRHLRDIVVTEYGIADLRGKSDRDTIAAMLSVADTRFQDELLQRAKHTGFHTCCSEPARSNRALPSRQNGVPIHRNKSQSCCGQRALPGICHCFHSAPISRRSSSS
jgi:acyl-CoA hydrolase